MYHVDLGVCVCDSNPKRETERRYVWLFAARVSEGAIVVTIHVSKVLMFVRWCCDDGGDMLFQWW